MKKTMKGTGLILTITMIALAFSGCGAGKTDGSSEKESTQDKQKQTEQSQKLESDSIGDFLEWEPFDIKPGQYFKYKTRVTTQGSDVQEGWFTIKISDEEEEQVTIEAEGKSGEDTFAFTVTDNKENAFGNIMMSMLTNPASQNVFTTIYSPFIGGGVWLMGISQGKIKVGNKWSYSSEGHSVLNEVVEISEYAGIKGYHIRNIVDGELESEVCLSPEFPLAIMSYVNADDVIYESELTEYKVE